MVQARRGKRRCVSLLSLPLPRAIVGGVALEPVLTSLSLRSSLLPSPLLFPSPSHLSLAAPSSARRTRRSRPRSSTSPSLSRSRRPRPASRPSSRARRPSQTPTRPTATRTPARRRTRARPTARGASRPSREGSSRASSRSLRTRPACSRTTTCSRCSGCSTRARARRRVHRCGAVRGVRSGEREEGGVGRSFCFSRCRAQGRLGVSAVRVCAGSPSLCRSLSPSIISSGCPVTRSLLLPAPLDLAQGYVSEAIRLLYVGTERVLLVLLHSFPDFLSQAAPALVDTLPPTAVHLKNLIVRLLLSLSACCRSSLRD